MPEEKQPPQPLALRTGSAVAEVEKQRAIAETIASIEVARRFPRDEKLAIEKVLMACSRPGLAESALYSYSRGGTLITGPSIRMAEALARALGNFQFGIRELEQRQGESTMSAYAWDVETNTRAERTFQVRHIRETRQGNKVLEDSRDIYELTANLGARRLRACLLQLVPQDIIDAAVDQVELTMRAAVDITPDLIKKLLAGFAEYGVTKEQIEERLQRNMDAITPALVVDLRKKYAALKDGMAQPSDFFKVAPPADAEAPKTATDKLREAVTNKTEPVVVNQTAATAPVQTLNEIVEEANSKKGNELATTPADPAPFVTGKKPCPLCLEKPGKSHKDGCPAPEGDEVAE